eukprot:3290721-Amphidinium_carterae.1
MAVLEDGHAEESNLESISMQGEPTEAQEPPPLSSAPTEVPVPPLQSSEDPLQAGQSGGSSSHLVRRRSEMDAAEVEVLQPQPVRQRTLPWPTPPGWHGLECLWTTPELLGQTLHSAQIKEIRIHTLPTELRRLFTTDPSRGRRKEWDAIQNSAGVRVHRGTAAREILERYPHRRIESRWLDKWKYMGPNHDNGCAHLGLDPRLEPKSRWIILGYQDPDLLQLERTVPTPTSTDLPLVLSLIAEHTPPEEGTIVGHGLTAPRDGYPEEHAEEIIVEDGGEHSSRHFTAWVFKDIRSRHVSVFLFDDLGLTKEGWTCTAQDPNCVSGSIATRACGWIVIETDDLFGGGLGTKWDGAIEKLRSQYKFGHWTAVTDGVEYGGRRVTQNADYSFTVDMTHYLRHHAEPVKLAPGRASQPHAVCTAAETSAYRGLLGSLTWAAREGLAQLVGETSLLASKLPSPHVQDIKDANGALARALETGIPIWIQSIPWEHTRRVVISDASLSNALEGRTQVAYAVFLAEKAVVSQGSGRASLVHFASHGMKRAGSSTLLVEANALSAGLAQAEWISSWLGLATDLNYKLPMRDKENRRLQIQALMREPEDSNMRLVAALDAKSLYDNLQREAFSGAERRAALEIAVIRDSLRAIGGR